MKILVSKRALGKTRILIVPSRRQHLPPVLVQGDDRDKVMDAARVAIKELSSNRSASEGA